MFILDTDHLSIYQRQRGEQFERLREKIEAHFSTDVIYISIVSFHEQFSGWQAYIHRAKKDAEVVYGYARFGELVKQYSEMNILPFDASCSKEFSQLYKQRVRIGTMDLRIAATALVHGYVVLTRNTVDFERVPGLKIEDWTVASKINPGVSRAQYSRAALG